MRKTEEGREALNAKQRAWRKTPLGRARTYERNDRYRARYPEKARARALLQKAVRRGKVHKPGDCQGCAQPFDRRQLHGHHDDYSKPLDVRWLCVRCHGEHHEKERTR